MAGGVTAAGDRRVRERVAPIDDGSDEVPALQLGLHRVDEDRVDLGIGDAVERRAHPQCVRPVVDRDQQQGVVAAERVHLGGGGGEVGDGRAACRIDVGREQLDPVLGAEPLEVVGDPALLVRGEDVRLIGDGLTEHGFAFGDDLPGQRDGHGRDQGQGAPAARPTRLCARVRPP